MEIYIVIVEDRHSDVEAIPYTNREKAIEVAKKLANKYCRYPEDYQEHDYGKDSGWLFYASYSVESDSVRVVTATMDKEI